MNYNDEKKRGNGLLVVVVILLVVLICVGGVLIYQNYQNENNVEQKVEQSDDNVDSGVSENKKEEEIVEELSLNSTIVNSLSNVFYQKYLTTESSEYDNYFYRDDKTIISDIPSDLKIVMAFRYLNNPDAVTRSQFEKAYKQIFSTTVTVPEFSETNLQKECVSGYKYDGNNGYYKIDGCGGAFCNHSESKITSAKRIIKGNEERIVITEAVVFLICEDNGKTGIYKDFTGKPFIESGKEFISYEVEDMDHFSGDSAQYDYTFVKDPDGIYVFTSVERVK